MGCFAEYISTLLTSLQRWSSCPARRNIPCRHKSFHFRGWRVLGNGTSFTTSMAVSYQFGEFPFIIVKFSDDQNSELNNCLFTILVEYSHWQRFSFECENFRRKQLKRKLWWSILITRGFRELLPTPTRLKKDIRKHLFTDPLIAF